MKKICIDIINNELYIPIWLQNGILFGRMYHMPAITIKNIPGNLYKSLKESAKAHYRSINSETIACLERIVGASKFEPVDTIDRIVKLRKQIRVPKLTERILNEARKKGRP